MNFDQISVHQTPEESPGYLLWRVSTRWRRAIEEVLKPLGLTHPQFVILAVVGWLTRNGEKVSQSDVAQQASLDPNTTSQILRTLQTKKWIKRSRLTDERSKCPTLTEAGALILSQALPAVEKADAEFFALIDLKETKMLTGLQKLAVRDTG